MICSRVLTCGRTTPCAITGGGGTQHEPNVHNTRLARLRVQPRGTPLAYRGGTGPAGGATRRYRPAGRLVEEAEGIVRAEDLAEMDRRLEEIYFISERGYEPAYDSVYSSIAYSED